jgi:ribosomal protein L11 methyltransferase
MTKLCSTFLTIPFTGVEERMDELVVTFKSEDWKQELAQEIISDLKKISEDAEILQISSITEQNWNEEFEKSVKPIIVNENIGITPEWKKDEINTKIKILINPKMSFGTGDHESTRLISRLAEKVVKPDSKWIDVGTGTGVLAILGIKLGAKEVFRFRQQ